MPTKHLTSVHCNLCGSGRTCLVYRKKRPAKPAYAPSAYTISETHLEKPEKIVRCMACGLVYAVTGAGSTLRILKDYAEMEDPEYLKEERGRRAQAAAILSQFKIKRGGRLLDVGCGPGFFLDEA